MIWSVIGATTSIRSIQWCTLSLKGSSYGSSLGKTSKKSFKISSCSFVQNKIKDSYHAPSNGSSNWGYH